MTPEQYEVIEHEARERRATRDRLRSELAAAEETFRRTRTDADGEAVANLTSRLRLAELALEGAEQDLEAARPYAPVELTHSRKSLEREIERITRQRDRRRLTLQRKIEQVRSGFRRGTPEEHIKIHLQNMQLDPPGHIYQRDEARDEELLENFRAQLAEYDRLERKQQTETDEPAADVA